MRLVQINAWGGKLGTQLQRFIADKEPDIICLQETTDLSPRPGSVLASHDEYAPESVYPHRIFAPVFSYRYMHEIAEFGNAIMCKVPFSESYSEFTKGAHFDDIDSLKDDYNVRNFVHVTLEIDDKPIHIITHHGHHSPQGKDGSEENTKQNQQIARYISQLEGPVILTGDFNLHPVSESLKPILENMISLPVLHNVASTRTILAKRQEIIDYIFVTKDVHVDYFEACEDLVSDHKALILDFRI